MMLTGCKPDPDPEDPTTTTHTVVYKIDDHTIFDDLVISPCFKVNVTYTDAKGQSVTENNATLPWTKSIEVTLPFHAKMNGTFTFNEADLPDQVIFGKCYGMGIDGSMDLKGNMSSTSKQKFLEYLGEHPDYLSFTVEKDF